MLICLRIRGSFALSFYTLEVCAEDMLKTVGLDEGHTCKTIGTMVKVGLVVAVK